LVALLAMAVSVPALAEIKVGYVDFVRLVQESPQFKAMRDALMADFGPKQRDLQSQGQALKARAEKLQKDAPTMTDDQKSRAEQELRELDRSLQRKGQDLQDEANARNKEEMTKLQNKLASEVQAFAKAQNYDLVVTDAIYYTQSTDLTPQILASLQAKSGTAGATHASSSAPAKPTGH
jgi:outer membrane protein